MPSLREAGKASAMRRSPRIGAGRAASACGAGARGCAAAPLLEGRDAGLGAAQDQGVHVVRALVGVDRLEVEQVPDDVEFVDDAVTAVHIARRARDIERLAAGVALHDRGDLRRGLALVAKPAQAQANLL